MHRLLIPGFFGLSILLFSCSSSNDNEIAEADVKVERVDLQQIAHDNNAFAFDLYHALRDNSHNLLFSPYSISSALSVPYIGAVGDTAMEIGNALHFNLTPVHTAQGYGILNAELTSNADDNLSHPQLNLANALWIQKGEPLLTSFISMATADQGGELHEVSFKDNLDFTRMMINQWVQQKTQNKIQDLIKPNVISKDTRLLIVSAIYLKAKWRHGFDPKKTQDAPFYLDSGKTKNVPFMHATGAYPILDKDQFSLLQMPYKGGVDSPDLAMIFILPKEGKKLSDIADQLTVDNLTAWINASHEQRADVIIPKFNLTEELSLEDALRELGMNLPFTAKADFSGITGRKDLMISKVVHQAFASVDENGTEAAAATGVSMNVTSIYEPVKSYVFKADHPFIFIIYDRRSETILFLGRLSQPGLKD